MKKLISLFVVAMMVITCVVPAFAAETANVVLATNKEKYEIGETVEVSVSVDGKFNTYEAYFQYDKEALKFDTIAGASIYSEDMVTNANAEDVFGGGVVFTIYFTAQKAGEYTVALDEAASYFSYGLDLTDYDVTYTTATVVVEGKEEPAPHVHTEEVIPAVAATCTETGLTEGKKCSECGEILVAQEVVEALGHKEVVVAGIAATCEKTGLTEGKKCSECGEILVAQEVVAKLAHKYEDGVCSECGAKDPNYKPNEPVVSGKSTFIVKAEAGLNGKISPEGSFEVREGKDKTFKITANEGFVIDVLTVDRKEIAKAAGQESYTLTLEDIDENYNIKVTFVKEVAPVVDDKANPSTGANDFVGAAVALAVVSVMGAAVISKK